MEELAALDSNFEQMTADVHRPHHGLNVRFQWGTWVDHKASKEAGREVKKDVPWIRIQGGGSKDFILRPAFDEDYVKYPVEYQHFKAAKGDEEVIVGTRLEDVAWVSRAQVEELTYWGIRSVEQLAAAPDSDVQGVMAINTLKQKAKDWLEQEGSAQKQLDDANKTIAAMEARLAALETNSKPAKAEPVEQPTSRRRRSNKESRDGESEA